MNRALRAATMGVLLLSPVALTACSAGQVTQTVTQERDKVGAMASQGDITLRQVVLEYPEGGRYEEGDDARLIMAIVNSGTEEDTLVGIEGEAFDGVRVTGTGAEASPTAPTGTPEASPTSPTTPGATPTTTPGGSTATGSTRVSIPIPADSVVYLNDEAVSVELTGLAEELTTGESVELVLSFERAGEITVQALVANPDEVLTREEPFDFHQEEEEHGTEVAGGGNPESGN
ncbi:MAG TPA: hypothetical protein VHF92_05365 [Geodermatophilus sp.]|nr:hypothetical protein [Geodermatophilus sp.]